MKDLTEKYFNDTSLFVQSLTNKINKLQTTGENVNDYIDTLVLAIYNKKFEIGKSGLIYCMTNVCFNYYGNDIYKLGNTDNLEKRTQSYVTNYIDPCQYVLRSKCLNNCELAEQILFYILDSYRINPNREFFKCPIDKIKDAFVSIEIMFATLKNKIVIDKIVNLIKTDVLKLLKSNNVDLNCKIIKHNKNHRFDDAILYFCKEKYKSEICPSHHIRHITNNKVDIITEMINLFWIYGILTKKEIHVYSNETKFTEEQRLFIKNKYSVAASLFHSIKRNTIPNTPYQLMQRLQSIISEFFGEYIRVNISIKKQKNSAGKKYCYYVVSIDSTKFIELMLNKYNLIIDDKYMKTIHKLYRKCECAFKDMHGYNTINDLLIK